MRSHVRSALAFVFIYVCPALFAQDAGVSPVLAFNSGVLRATVTEIAAVVSREYMDPEIGDRLGDSPAGRDSRSSSRNVRARR
jgi:hypothetical protein